MHASRLGHVALFQSAHANVYGNMLDWIKSRGLPTVRS